MLRKAALGLGVLLISSAASAEIYQSDLNDPLISSVQILEVPTSLDVEMSFQDALNMQAESNKKDKSTKDKKKKQVEFDDCNNDVFQKQPKRKKKTYRPMVMAASKKQSKGINLSQVINFAKELWKIVEKGKPVVRLSVDKANALPQGYQCWTDLENWEKPIAKSYQVLYKNGFGMTAAKMTYTLIYTWGGSVAGKGEYLTNVTVIPSNVDVIWGYNLTADVTIPNVINMGTKKKPTAGMDVEIAWTVKTPVKESSSVHRFFVQGDGDFISLN